MRKKRVLMVTECSVYPTGYGVYTKELLSRLHTHPDFEVAELACYVAPGDERIASIPWGVFPNKPSPDHPEAHLYDLSTTAEFGEFSFNNVCLRFRPDFVIDIRDPWVFEFETRSPFRSFYQHILMPTVDAMPQNPEWIEMFGEADAVLTYSEFGAATIRKQSSRIKYVGTASPCASQNFYPKNQVETRTKYGLDKNAYIFGTVMRNQRRKLYPDLFKTFKQFLDKSGRTDVFLYCHTSFPDQGWNIPELLLEYGLSSRVLFTYKCKNCKNVTSSFFQDAVCYCSKCNNYTNNMISVGNGVDETELSDIYSLFDVYIQYANSEGFGMPQLEAAQCGVMVASIDYSAMSSVIQNISGVPIPVAGFAKEAETGCLRAIPDNARMVNYFEYFSNLPKTELAFRGQNCHDSCVINYNWDATARKWIEALQSLPIKPHEETWLSPSLQRPPAPFNPNLILPGDRANYLIGAVLGKPEFIGGRLWRRLSKDLTYGTTVESAGNQFYFNESHLKDNLRAKIFTYEDAYKAMVDLREYHNVWEANRMKAGNIL